MPHAYEVFTTLKLTFDDTYVQEKTLTKICIQISRQVELVEGASVELVEGATNQLVAKKERLIKKIRIIILKMKCNFKRGLMLPIILC
jgi:hypothetical protein